MKYKVAPIEDVEAAGETLTELWRDNLGFSFPPESKHSWYYRDNPQGSTKAFFLHPEADVSKAPVGCIGVGARRFSVRGEDAEAGIFVDMAVDKHHRTLFPALMLLRAARRHAKQCLAFAYGEPNENAINVFVKTGYKKVGQMRRYVRVLRHAHYLERVVSQPLLASLGGPVLDRLMQARELLIGPRVPSHLEFTWVNAIDERFDNLWKNARGAYTVVGYRGADYLRWRYHQAPPDCRCDLGVLCDKRTGNLLGYVAVHDEGPIAGLYDIFGYPEKLELLIAALLPQLRKRGYESVSIGLFGAPLLVEMLEAQGFRHREVGLDIVVDPLSHPAVGSLTNETSWYLTEGDQDG